MAGADGQAEARSVVVEIEEAVRCQGIPVEDVVEELVADLHVVDREMLRHRAVLVRHDEPLVETERAHRIAPPVKRGRINAQLYRARYRSNLENTRWHTAIEEHEEILARLEARDRKGLAAIMKSHLGSTWAKLAEVDDSDRKGLGTPQAGDP